jgi:hypothetical protein
MTDKTRRAELVAKVLQAAYSDGIAAALDRALEAAAGVALAYPALTHGALPSDAHAAAYQAAQEIGIAILALKEPRP